MHKQPKYLIQMFTSWFTSILYTHYERQKDTIKEGVEASLFNRHNCDPGSSCKSWELRKTTPQRCLIVNSGYYSQLPTSCLIYSQKNMFVSQGKKSVLYHWKITPTSNQKITIWHSKFYCKGKQRGRWFPRGGTQLRAWETEEQEEQHMHRLRSKV